MVINGNNLENHSNNQKTGFQNSPAAAPKKSPEQPSLLCPSLPHDLPHRQSFFALPMVSGQRFETARASSPVANPDETLGNKSYSIATVNQMLASQKPGQQNMYIESKALVNAPSRIKH